MPSHPTAESLVESTSDASIIMVPTNYLAGRQSPQSRGREYLLLVNVELIIENCSPSCWVLYRYRFVDEELLMSVGVR